MSKTSGLGQFLLAGGIDLSGDVGSLSSIHGGPAALEVTGIDKAAPERIGGLLDGAIDYAAWFNKAVGQAHPTLSPLPTGDVIVMLGTGSTVGLSAACMVGKQLDYAATRGADGALSMTVPNPANGSSLEWCDLLTAGKRTDTTATDGTTLDGVAASTTGWAAYLEVTAFTGTSVTVTIEDSANGSTWAAVTGGAFTAATAVGAQRIEGASGATLRRYVRATTSGTFTSATFAASITRHPVGALA